MEEATGSCEKPGTALRPGDVRLTSAASFSILSGALRFSSMAMELAGKTATSAPSSSSESPVRSIITGLFDPTRRNGTRT